MVNWKFNCVKRVAGGDGLGDNINFIISRFVFD